MEDLLAYVVKESNAFSKLSVKPDLKEDEMFRELDGFVCRLLQDECAGVPCSRIVALYTEEKLRFSRLTT